jgi:hypothetical protein
VLCTSGAVTVLVALAQGRTVDVAALGAAAQSFAAPDAGSNA